MVLTDALLREATNQDRKTIGSSCMRGMNTIARIANRLCFQKRSNVPKKLYLAHDAINQANGSCIRWSL